MLLGQVIAGRQRTRPVQPLQLGQLGVNLRRIAEKRCTAGHRQSIIRQLVAHSPLEPLVAAYSPGSQEPDRRDTVRRLRNRRGRPVGGCARRTVQRGDQQSGGEVVADIQNVLVVAHAEGGREPQVGHRKVGDGGRA